MHTSLCVCRMSHSALKEYVCVFCVCVCVLVRESGCRNQVKRKSNTWLNGGGFSLNLLQPKMNMHCFHMCKCVHLCFCMFAHVPAGFINDLSQCQVTCVSAPVYFCLCECHARDQTVWGRLWGQVWGRVRDGLEKWIGRIVTHNMAAVAMEIQPFR